MPQWNHAQGLLKFAPNLRSRFPFHLLQAGFFLIPRLWLSPSPSPIHGPGEWMIE